jgi:hypothetical protein
MPCTIGLLVERCLSPEPAKVGDGPLCTLWRQFSADVLCLLVAIILANHAFSDLEKELKQGWRNRGH